MSKKRRPRIRQGENAKVRDDGCPAWRCPQCFHADVSVLETRRAKGQNAGKIRRRKQCESCGFRYTTHETIVE